MIDFLLSIVTLIKAVIGTIIETSDKIDSITFDDTAFVDWLGYARYAMGDPMYILFTTTVLISIGITLWSYLLKGLGLIRNLLPW